MHKVVISLNIKHQTSNPNVIFVAQKYRKQLENRIRVGAVSYLNTKPLLYGLERLEVRHWMDLTLDYPAEVARQLKAYEIDMGLVPVAILPEMDDYYIDADYCIGANGPVGSVGIFSNVPLGEVETVLLDYQSYTSVELCKILMKHYWKLTPKFVPALPGYLDEIKGKVAGVVIGDRAFAQRTKSKYEFDLADAWKKMTGLPFVFAAWVSNKQLPEDFIDAFNKANEWGLTQLDKVVAQNPSTQYDLMYYYTKNISYKLDEEKRKGMQLFLDYLQKSI